MYLRKVAYQLGVRVKSLLPRFHKSDLRNLALSLVKIPVFSKLGSLHKRELSADLFVQGPTSRQTN